MAWHMAQGQRSSRHMAQPGQMGMECRERQGAPSSANPGQIYTRASNPPGQSCPKDCVGMGPRSRLRDKDWSWHHGPATQPVPRRFRAVPVSCCHPDPVASAGHLELHPSFPIWPCRWLRAHDPAQGRGSGVLCPARAGRQTAVPAGRVAGQQHSWGLPHRLVSTVPAACWPVPSVPGLSRGRQGQPGGISPLCHPAVALRASKQEAQLCHSPQA